MSNSEIPGYIDYYNNFGYQWDKERWLLLNTETIFEPLCKA